MAESFRQLLAPVYAFMIGSGKVVAVIIIAVLIIYLVKRYYDKKAWEKHKSDPCTSTNKWWDWNEYEKIKKQKDKANKISKFKQISQKSAGAADLRGPADERNITKNGTES